jgi:VanZ family protein
MTVYAVLYALLFRSFNADLPATTARRWITPFFVCVLYAIADEMHQSFVPHRYPTLRDIGYDALGMSVAFLRIYRYI